MQQSGSWSFFLLTLVILPRYVMGQQPSGIPSAFDCSQFNAPGPCVKYTDLPTQVNGINIDLYRYVDGWTTPNPTGDFNIAAISNAITTVLPIFSTFAPAFSVDVVLVTALGDPAYLGLTGAAPNGTPCYVRVLQQPINDTDASAVLKRGTAHELYHCVQFRNQGGKLPAIAGVGWWIEGSANYFGNRFYQDNRPSTHMTAYDPNVALYNQATAVRPVPERASLFFQFLSNQGWGDNTINAFVVKQIQDAQNGMSQRTIMSSNLDLQRLFPIFAQKFSGLEITFSDGGLAQGNPGTPINKIDIPLTSLQSNGQQYLAPVTIPSFAMGIYTATLQPGITYTIQWEPPARDGKTVLIYQQASDPSSKTWTTFDPATPIQIPIDCSSNPVQYKFLLTSTADEDVSRGQLLFVRKSSQSCDCNDVGIPLDPCLSGNWTLDLNAFQSYLSDSLAALQHVTISNIVASGASTFNFPEGGMGGMTFNALDIDYNGTSSGYSFHTTIDLTGSVSGRMVMQATGQFCWADGQGQGQADTSTTVAGLGSPVVLNVALASAYVAPTITVNYTCSATSLQLVGSDNGQYAWALSYVKA